jgi:putative dimethyl sulfoxide reductase chaperone
MSQYDPDEATAREDMCRFLSACFYEPVPEFAEEDLFGSMVTAASRIDPDLADEARQLGKAFAAEDLQTLLVDYTRLFLGPVQAIARPYGSCWLTQPEADSRSAVLDLYDAGGFEVDEGFRELPDHVAVELEFLYLLTFRRNDALRAGQADEVSALEELERQFLAEHLGAWVRPFSAAIRTGAQTAFYRHLAGMTERFVLVKAASLGIPV